MRFIKKIFAASFTFVIAIGAFEAAIAQPVILRPLVNNPLPHPTPTPRLPTQQYGLIAYPTQTQFQWKNNVYYVTTEFNNGTSVTMTSYDGETWTVPLSNGTVQYWIFTLIRDPNGNVILYAYQVSAGQAASSINRRHPQGVTPTQAVSCIVAGRIGQRIGGFIGRTYGQPILGTIGAGIGAVFGPEGGLAGALIGTTIGKLYGQQIGQDLGAILVGGACAVVVNTISNVQIPPYQPKLPPDNYNPILPAAPPLPPNNDPTCGYTYTQVVDTNTGMVLQISDPQFFCNF